jgi:hypothetical protein
LARRRRDYILGESRRNTALRDAINGTKVTFDDIPKDQIREIDVDVEGYGVAHLIVIDTLKADRSTRQHGIAWVVNNRMVGSPGWVGFDQERAFGRSQ